MEQNVSIQNEKANIKVNIFKLISCKNGLYSYMKNKEITKYAIN